MIPKPKPWDIIFFQISVDTVAHAFQVHEMYDEPETYW